MHCRCLYSSGRNGAARATSVVVGRRTGRRDGASRAGNCVGGVAAAGATTGVDVAAVGCDDPRGWWVEELASWSGVGLMTGVLLGVIGVIVLGLPLVALGVDRVLPQAKARPAPADPLRELSQRHHLTTRDFLEVQAAVRDGRAVTPDSIAPAAVEHATYVMTLDMNDRPRRPRRWHPSKRAARVLLVVYVLLLIGFIAYGVVAGKPTVFLGLLYLFQLGVGLPVQRRAWRRRQAAARAALVANQALVRPVGELDASPGPVKAPCCHNTIIGISKSVVQQAM